jgi:hypothetical protein
MTNKDWYVALTRASRSIRVLAPSQALVPYKRQGDRQPRQQSFSFN